MTGAQHETENIKSLLSYLAEVCRMAGGVSFSDFTTVAVMERAEFGEKSDDELPSKHVSE
jgi:hypothetical protein